MRHSRIARYLRHGTLPQLRVFEAVARHGNFTRAAEELHMAQPTASSLVRKLTDVVGLPLLEQVGRRIYPTATGNALIAAGNEMLDTLERFESTLCDLREGRTGTLRIAADTTVKYIVARLLAEFARRHPAIDVSLLLLPCAALKARLAEDADDLYLLTHPPKQGGVVVRPMLPHPFVVLARPDHPLARAKAIPFARFAREPMLVREPGSSTRAVSDHAFAQHRLIPKVAMELGSNEAIKEAMLAGTGVAILARHSLGLRVAPNELAELDVEGFPVELYCHAAYPAGKHLAPPAQSFIELLQRDAKRLLAAAPAPASRGGTAAPDPQRSRRSRSR